MRILMIDPDPRYHELVRHHAACQWPKAQVVSYDAETQGELPAEFLAQGYDAVIIGASPEDTRAIARLESLVRREGFAPVIFLSAHRDENETPQSLEGCANAELSKTKIDHRELIAALDAAARWQAEQRARRRISREGIEARTFGEVKLPGYRHIRRIASGSISDLYLAESEQAGSLVVLKIARDKEPDGELDNSFKRFLQEYEITRRVRHPSVVRLYDLGVSDEHAYLVMEYFPAGDLRKRMRAGIAPGEALRLSARIARALEAIHSAGVLHRDLKPGNVMLREDGSVALIDFGFAKDAALEMEVTDQGTIFGTPHYMSPEQGHGEPIDGRSDIYSLGVMLYEMLTGQKPFVSDNPMAIVYMHRKTPIPRLPAELAQIQPLIDRLMAKKPADRFATAGEAAAALEAAAASPFEHGAAA